MFGPSPQPQKNVQEKIGDSVDIQIQIYSTTRFESTITTMYNNPIHNVQIVIDE